ncbi:hypothetical protein RHSIM_Rhsim02G0057700 [Rhododendron simsii]|uniref:Uncharacterized protein n=1 Tax=Rhododendron simsii TaxID=118357 RepID=A0A834LUN0_RHOSS|nr:hypothetical protein RHSIM_Rhsim02G0057700 [Rhododendron simsii]
MANVGIHGVRDGSLIAAKGCSSASSCWHFETPGAVDNPQQAKPPCTRKHQTNPTVITHHPPDLGETQTGNLLDLGETQTGNTSGSHWRRRKQKSRKTYNPYTFTTVIAQIPMPHHLLKPSSTA